MDTPRPTFPVLVECTADMGPSEFRKRLTRLGLSQSEAARRMGVSVRAVQHWCAGERTIPGPVVALLDAWTALDRIRRQVED